MPTRLVHLAVDSADPARLARFWAATLGWELISADPEEADIEPAGYSYPDPVAVPMVFVPVPEPKSGKNRLHLDLNSESPAHQQAEIERLLALGATRADIGQGDVPWQVLADPEGNEFCVLDPRPVDTGRFTGVVADCSDPAAVADFWELATGWVRVGESAGEISLRSPRGLGPYLTLLKVPDAKAVKNRIHLDVAPEPGEDHAEAVRRLVAAGAVPADVGQGDVPWVVLAGPEDSEFCVLTPR